MKRHSPFRLKLRSLTKPTPRRIYRFRRRVKQLRVYLALYTLPADPPAALALDALFRRAGKLRQAYLTWQSIQDLDFPLEKVIRKQIKKQRKRFLEALRLHRKEVRALLHQWRKLYPPPWKQGRVPASWLRQGERWVQLHKAKLMSLPPVPETPEQFHELRRVLRSWELAARWVELPAVPPPSLTKALGEARDLYLFVQWLRKKGVEETFYEAVEQNYRQAHEAALSLWQAYRSAL
ncbi:MAG: hypothetical protein NZ580_03190 [Bacteroidia bacterium]|nr:hypothetical protein [Bacteroidia bacterium]MDW8235606.1 hypothetical protein [Bacteroidia bacterium]